MLTCRVAACKVVPQYLVQCRDCGPDFNRVKSFATCRYHAAESLTVALDIFDVITVTHCPMESDVVIPYTCKCHPEKMEKIRVSGLYGKEAPRVASLTYDERDPGSRLTPTLPHSD